MGVHGLTTYISERSDLYLEPFELRDSFLVVDGNSVCCQLYLLVNSRCVFGGDYDEYYKKAKTFFSNMIQCKVKPVVLFDGGHEPKKLETLLKRAKEKVRVLSMIKCGKIDRTIFPIFLEKAFIDVLKELNIACIRCYFEGDGEIASVADALNCPVLSFDSDYYMFDVSYIPFSSLKMNPVKVIDSSKKVKYHLQCSIYNLEKFLKVNRLEKPLMPILITLLGNDYVNNCIFALFFEHVIIPKNKKESYAQRKIEGIMRWLRKENYDSAIKGILLHVKNKNSRKILSVIRSTAKYYSKGFVSLPVYREVTKLANSENISLKVRKVNVSWPAETDLSYSQCKLSGFFINFITYNKLFTPIQVEDLSLPSTILPSIDIIKAIDRILNPYKANNKSITSSAIYLVQKGKYRALSEKAHDDGRDRCNFNLIEILEMSSVAKLQILFDILKFEEKERRLIASFGETDWGLFFAALLYWAKQLKNEISTCFVCALLLMAISNRIVQKNAGYFKNKFAFKCKYKSFVSPIGEKDQGVVVVCERSLCNFGSLVSRVTKEECISIQEKLIPFRQAKMMMFVQRFSLSAIHRFNSFQSCLYYLREINALIGKPMKNLKINEFYSGTLLFNLYSGMEVDSSKVSFSKEMLKEAPNVEKLYDYLCNSFLMYCFASENNSKNLEKKGRKKMVGGQKRIMTLV